MAKMTAKSALGVVLAAVEREQDKVETQSKERAIKRIKQAIAALERETIELTDPTPKQPS